MPPRDHLPLWRLVREEPRRKHGFGTSPPRNFVVHGARITRQLDTATMTARARPQLPGVDPKLILKVELTNLVA